MLTEPKDQLRGDRAALDAELRSLGSTVRGNCASCPFHDDRTPSASVRQGTDGAWRLRCHAAECGFHGDLFDVRARASGKSVEDVLREVSGPTKPKPTAKPTAPATPPEGNKLRVYATLDALKATINHLQATYVYADPDTRHAQMVVLRVVEGGKKRFLQARPEAGGFVLMAPPKPWPLYNRSRVRDAGTVLIVEGEKCVHALTDVLPAGFAATTSPGGAGKAKYADWSPLAGKAVYLWPDNDDAGQAHMRDAWDAVGRLDPPAELYWIDPAAVGLTDPKDDAADFLARLGGDAAEAPAGRAAAGDAVLVALSRAARQGPSADLLQQIEDSIAGRFGAVGWPWPAVGGLTKALRPGTVTLVCGNPGSAKSFLLLEAAMHWQDQGVKFALYELEENRAFWLARVLAMRAGEARLTDPDWVRQNPDAARAAYAEHRAALDGFARRLAVAGDKQLTHGELIAWVRAQAEAGCRVIGVDPVTALRATEKPWVDDLAFMMDAKAVAARHGCSLVFVTHPRIGRGRPGSPLDSLAGGAAYVRFAQTVLWVHSHAQGKRFRWKTMAGTFAGPANRSVKIAKARSAAGGGLEVAFAFDPGTLRFKELGVAIKESADEAEEEVP